MTRPIKDLDSLFAEFIDAPKGENTLRHEDFSRSQSISKLVRPVRPLRVTDTLMHYLGEEASESVLPTQSITQDVDDHNSLRVSDEYWTEMSQTMRTVLQSIIGYTEMIEEDLLCDETTNSIEDLHRIKKAGIQLLSLAQDVEEQILAEREKRRLAERLHALNHRLNGVQDIAHIFSFFTDSIRALAPLTEAHVYLVKGQQEVSRLVSWFQDEVTEADDDSSLLLDGRLIKATRRYLSPCIDTKAALGSRLAVPVVIEGECSAVVLLGCATKNFWSEHMVGVVSAFVDQIESALLQVQQMDSMKKLATTDPLTGLANRRHFFDQAEAFELDPERVAGVVLLDIDFFKKINDTYGHGPGDQVLQEVSRRLTTQLRGSDLLCRYGGEEFAMILADAGEMAACEVAERLRLSIANTRFDIDGHGPIDVTISLGITHLGGRLLEDALKTADEALYQAKDHGRNRIWYEKGHTKG